MTARETRQAREVNGCGSLADAAAARPWPRHQACDQ
jgi:hypothetical protein